MIKLYPATSPDAHWSEDAVQEFEANLRDWQDQTPEFFHPNKSGGISAADEPVLFEIPWSFKR